MQRLGDVDKMHITRPDLTQIHTFGSFLRFRLSDPFPSHSSLQSIIRHSADTLVTLPIA